jgi:arsenical pump membrane protein
MNLIILVTMVTMLVSFRYFPSFKINQITIQSYWVITTIGAIAVWIASSFSFAFIDLALAGAGTINPIRILGLFFSFTLLAIFLDEVGLIKYLAYLAIRRAGQHQLTLFIAWYLITALLTILTANDIVILTLTPFIIYFSRHAKISPIPYLVSQFVAANTWSMMFIIGNPTNIYLASIFGIPFIDYFQVMIIPTLFTGLAGFTLLLLIFYPVLKSPLQSSSIQISPPHQSYQIGVWTLSLAILLMIFAQTLRIGMDVLTMMSALLLIIYMLIIYPKEKFLKQTLTRLPYAMVPFFLSMAILVHGLNLSGLTEYVESFLRLFPPIYSYGISSFIVSNLLNNIPMTLWFSNVLFIQPSFSIAAVYATIIGSNLGALLTPVGALAGLMWLTILKEKQIHFSVRQFIRYGLFFGFTLLLIALVSLDVFFG